MSTIVVALLLIAGLWWLASGSGDPDPASGLPVIAQDELPPEAIATMELIEQGGPFPYGKDGAVFSNFEGLLPGEAAGYYREYTVPTPGEDDRGARRIVTGNDGEMYYTADHYESFALIEGTR